jgi:hypothetical protein
LAGMAGFLRGMPVGVARREPSVEPRVTTH